MQQQMPKRLPNSIGFKIVNPLLMKCSHMSHAMYTGNVNVSKLLLTIWKHITTANELHMIISQRGIYIAKNSPEYNMMDIDNSLNMISLSMYASILRIPELL